MFRFDDGIKRGVDHRAVDYMYHCEPDSKLYSAARRVVVKVMGEDQAQQIENIRALCHETIPPTFSVRYGRIASLARPYQATIKHTAWGIWAIVNRTTAKEMYTATQSVL